MDEPERWLTSADAPLEMRDMLQAARAEAPSPDAVARVGARLGNPTSGFGSGLPARGMWLVGTVGLVGAGLAGYWALPTDAPASRAPAAQIQAPAPAAAEPNAAPFVAARPAEEEPLSERTPPPKSEVTRSASASAGGPAEVALIRQARAAVEQDPELALRLAEKHRQTFPQGKLAEEREVIAVQALARLGRTKDAEGRAATFAQEHPTSPHKARVERESKATE